MSWLLPFKVISVLFPCRRSITLGASSACEDKLCRSDREIPGPPAIMLPVGSVLYVAPTLELLLSESGHSEKVGTVLEDI